MICDRATHSGVLSYRKQKKTGTVAIGLGHVTGIRLTLLFERIQSHLNVHVATTLWCFLASTDTSFANPLDTFLNSQ